MKKHSSNQKTKNFSYIALLLVFILGFCILMYPIVANWWNSKVQTRVISNYESVIQEIDEKDYSAFFDAADDFNEKLLNMVQPFFHVDELTEYDDILNVDGSGVIGYVNIDKIKVEIPIYHGTDADSLNAGAGHLEGSSFPVGGIGTHAALSAHRGLPSSKLFSDLDSLEEGDLFTITVLDRLLTYKVDQIKIVLPNELDDLKIEPDHDYCTLVTCTPYGINTHRLLVRGTRVDNVKIKPQIYVPNEANKIDPLIVTPVLAIPLLILMLIGVSIKYRKK